MPSTRGRFILAFGGSGLFVALSVILAARNALFEQPLPVDFSSPPIANEESGQQQVRFALTAVWTPERTFEQYLEFGDYLAARLDRPVRLVQRKTYGEIVELLRLGGVDVAVLCTGAFLSAQASGVKLEALAVPVTAQGPYYHSLFLVRTDSGIGQLEQLRGRRFGFTDPMSLSGYHYPRSIARSQGPDADGFFGGALFTYSHDGSIRAVLDGIVDGAAVDSMVFQGELERRPDLAQQLQIIHRSPQFGISPVVVPRSGHPKLRNALRTALLGMDSSQTGRAILADLRLSRFQVPPDDLFVPAQAVMNGAGKPPEGQAKR
jgi:phosphonate transport system substrate-binding protein